MFRYALSGEKIGLKYFLIQIVNIFCFIIEQIDS